MNVNVHAPGFHMLLGQKAFLQVVSHCQCFPQPSESQAKSNVSPKMIEEKALSF